MKISRKQSVMLAVLHERGLFNLDGQIRLPDNWLDVQWRARDKAQNARNDMREAFYVHPSKLPPSLGPGFVRLNRKLFPGKD